MNVDDVLRGFFLLFGRFNKGYIVRKLYALSLLPPGSYKIMLKIPIQ